MAASKNSGSARDVLVKALCALAVGCAKCEGRGEYLQPAEGSLGWEDMRLLPCPKCQGSGWDDSAPETVH